MNWPSLLAALRCADWTQLEIATHCGVSQATISDLSRGVIKAPSFDLGTKLVELHKVHVGGDGSTTAGA